ncbi:unnamed protein product [Symbiodinium necroappetens]|uniref:Uncharacterized protein n=1 Tax=Symbiodinium necroappetens TaxID=1628268 RepID=A0A812KXI7_9DINO|nr:unnamed protein product [Symbiodinium necroappetens]
MEFRNYVLLELCWLHFEKHLVTTHGQDRRQASARLSGHKKAFHNQAAVSSLEALIDKLDEASADCLQMEFRFLQNTMERPLRRNDIAWILSTGSQWGPSKQLTLQCLCRLVFRTLSANMASLHMAQTLARIIHDRALPLWYHPTFVALLPLVPKNDVGRLQDWYANYVFQSRSHHALLYGQQPAEAEPNQDVQPPSDTGAGSSTDGPRQDQAMVEIPFPAIEEATHTSSAPSSSSRNNAGAAP